MSGIYLITTPIGNIKDITTRAIETLEQADYIYCEDTRVFKKLANLLGLSLVNKTIHSFHDHSSDEAALKIIELAQDHKCAFVSDAGSPIVSDPAYPLVVKAIEHSVEVHSVSGINSVIAALELSGLPPIPMHFYGFLARDNSKKNKEYESFAGSYGTHIFFEGVSRVKKTLKELTELYPDLDFVVARELTKEYESVYRFKGQDFSGISEQIIEKGEFVILLHNPHKQNQLSSPKLQEMAAEVLADGGRVKSLSKLLSALTGIPNKEVYQQLTQSK